MTVYIEYVLIDNFVIDYLILKATFKITGNPAKKSRLFLSAFFGAFFALIFPLIDFNAYLTVIIKIASALIILLIANGYQTNKSYYVTSVIFLSLTFALGGAVIGVYSILNLDYSNELSIAFMILPVYLFVKVIMELINYFFSRSKEESYFVTCTLYAENESLTLRGFIDSGNSLYYDNKPVIVIDKKDLLKYFKCQLIFKIG
ncbi:MAG: sigma-E processing peptidase SpoIIGA, partial [Clostridia bacterium]|nr:sigma-E processing peptidase SpoIIGA [Clostridia bacterium]